MDVVTTPIEGSASHRDVNRLVLPVVELASLGRDALVVAQRATAAARYLDAFCVGFVCAGSVGSLASVGC